MRKRKVRVGERGGEWGEREKEHASGARESMSEAREWGDRVSGARG